jgi:hypothetical protein
MFFYLLRDYRKLKSRLYVLLLGIPILPDLPRPVSVVGYTRWPRIPKPEHNFGYKNANIVLRRLIYKTKVILSSA